MSVHTKKTGIEKQMIAKIRNARKRIVEFDGLVNGRLKAQLVLEKDPFERARCQRERNYLRRQSSKMGDFLRSWGYSVPGVL
jgi:hypothetical protein